MTMMPTYALVPACVPDAGGAAAAVKVVEDWQCRVDVEVVCFSGLLSTSSAGSATTLAAELHDDDRDGDLVPHLIHYHSRTTSDSWSWQQRLVYITDAYSHYGATNMGRGRWQQGRCYRGFYPTLSV